MKSFGNKKKFIIVCAAALAVILAVAAALTIWNAPNFTGSRTKNPDAYIMKFDNMRGDDSHTLSLKEGDRLDVHIKRDVGHFGVVIGMSGEEPIYEGSGAEDMDFVLGVPKSGDYIINVSARQAKGEFTVRLIGEDESNGQ